MPASSVSLVNSSSSVVAEHLRRDVRRQAVGVGEQEAFQRGVDRQTDPLGEGGIDRRARADDAQEIVAAEGEQGIGVDGGGDFLDPPAGNDRKDDLAVAGVGQRGGDLLDRLRLLEEISPGFKLHVNVVGAHVIDKEVGVADQPGGDEVLRDQRRWVAQFDGEAYRSRIAAERCIQRVLLALKRELDQRSLGVIDRMPAGDQVQGTERQRADENEG